MEKGRMGRAKDTLPVPARKKVKTLLIASRRMSELLNAGFTDTFRSLYPDTVKYSWWSYRFKARERNAGWRIDYFLVSNRIRQNVKDAMIYDQIQGSDHCPVGLDISLF